MENCKPLSKRRQKKSQCVTFVHLWVIFSFLPTKLHYVYSPQPLRSRGTSCSHILWYIAGDLVMESKSVMTNVQDIKNMFIFLSKKETYKQLLISITAHVLFAGFNYSFTIHFLFPFLPASSASGYSLVGQDARAFSQEGSGSFAKAKHIPTSKCTSGCVCRDGTVLHHFKKYYSVFIFESKRVRERI